MSLDPSPVLGRMIKGAIMKRIEDPYYGAGWSNGGADDHPGLNKFEKAARSVLRFFGAGKRKGGMIHGDDDDEGADFSGGQVCASRPYMGYPGNVGSGYSGGRKRKPKRKATKRKATKVGKGYSGGRKPKRNSKADQIRSLKAKLGMGVSGGRKRKSTRVSMIGGRRKAPKRKAIGRGVSGGAKRAAKRNPWLIHLAKVRRQYPNESVTVQSQIASRSYKR